MADQVGHGYIQNFIESELITSGATADTEVIEWIQVTGELAWGGRKLCDDPREKSRQSVG